MPRGASSFSRWFRRGLQVRVQRRASARRSRRSSAAAFTGRCQARPRQVLQGERLRALLVCARGLLGALVAGLNVS